MTNSKKILITTASSEIFILRNGGRQKAIRGFCTNCEAETEMLDFSSAVMIFSLKTRELIRQIETGAIHTTETASGRLFVCQNSLQNFCK